MPPELDALIDKPLLLALVLAIGAIVGIGVERFVKAGSPAQSGDRLSRGSRGAHYAKRVAGVGGEVGARNLISKRV